jgi:hypothetical protein
MIVHQKNPDRFLFHRKIRFPAFSNDLFYCFVSIIRQALFSAWSATGSTTPVEGPFREQCIAWLDRMTCPANGRAADPVADQQNPNGIPAHSNGQKSPSNPNGLRQSCH